MLTYVMSVIPGPWGFTSAFDQVIADSRVTGVSNFRFLREPERLYRCANGCPGITGVATFLTPEATSGILNLDHTADSVNMVFHVRVAPSPLIIIGKRRTQRSQRPSIFVHVKRGCEEVVPIVAEAVPRLIGGAILATGGWRLGEHISDAWGPELYAPWVFSLAAAGVVLGLLATPYVTTRVVRALVQQVDNVPTSGLLSATLGLVVGLLVAVLLSIPLSRISGWLGVASPIAFSIFLAYLGASLMGSPRRDIFRKSIPDGTLSLGEEGDPAYNGKMILDTSAIIDGRIADISHTGFLRGTLLIPRFVLDELRHIADSSDSLRRTRGRRGLEMLHALRQEANIPIQVLDVDSGEGQEVDARLVGLATELQASIITTDDNLNRVAQIEGIPVLNVNELANSLRPAVLPGEGMIIRVIQDGKEPGQGVGFLDDGTMVVVDGGNRYLNQDLDVLVTRVLQTAAGCIIFTQPKRG